MERSVVEASDVVVSVTATLQQKLLGRYTKEPATKFALIPNGFDPAVQPRVEAVTRTDGNILVTYMGTVYGHTTARHYLDALDELPNEIRAAFETHFIGRITAEEAPFQQNRRSRVIIHGFLPQAEALRRLVLSDILLVNMTDPFCHTGKIFEYLATGKPILAFTPPDGELGRMLSHVGGAWIVHPDDRPAAVRTLREIYSLCHSGGERPRPKASLVQEFERPRLTRQYAELIRGARRSVG
jgi:glycosyltransferase involved in cell wall biosynthesis